MFDFIQLSYEFNLFLWLTSELIKTIEHNKKKIITLNLNRIKSLLNKPIK